MQTTYCSLNQDVVMRARTGPHVCMHYSEGKGDGNATADSGWGTELPQQANLSANQGCSGNTRHCVLP